MYGGSFPGSLWPVISSLPLCGLTQGPPWLVHVSFSQDEFQHNGFWEVGRTYYGLAPAPHLPFFDSWRSSLHICGLGAPLEHKNEKNVVTFSSSQSCLSLCNSMDCSTPDFPFHHQLPEFTQTHVHWVIDAIQPSHLLSSPSPPPSIFPSIRVFSNESTLHMRWPKYWSLSFSISPSNEYSELISFRTDWLDLLAVQGTLKSLLQHHSSKASIFQHSVTLVFI